MDGRGTKEADVKRKTTVLAAALAASGALALLLVASAAPPSAEAKSWRERQQASAKAVRQPRRKGLFWRLDPKQSPPKIEVIARGIRNAWTFAWDGEGRMFSASNGPDANAPEEMDLVEPGKHYGFPYQFADWPAKKGYPYPHTPAAPQGFEFTMPVLNVGPAGGGTAKQPIGTLDAHSSPGGMIWCGNDWPEPLRGTFLIPRFGNLLGPPAAPE